MGSANFIENDTYFKFDENNYFTFKTRRNKKLNLEMATFYTDSIHDLPLVEKCKDSIVVSPDDRLKKHAENNNLQIIYR